MVAIITVLETLTTLTARTIREFIGSSAAKEGIGWFTRKQLDKLLNDETQLNLLQDKLKNIQQKFEENKLNTSMNITVGTEWEHMHARLFQAEMDICHKFQLLQSILTSEESKANIAYEVKRLQDGILDTNNGILSYISVIHQELVGHTVNSTNKGLLAMWYKGVCNHMIENPMSAKTCYDNVIKHLDKAAILQFKGYLLFQGASDNSKFCAAQLKCFENNLKSQSDLMDTTISKHMKYLTDPNTNDVFYLRPVSDVRFEPYVKRRGDQKTLIYEYNLEHIEEEKWTFEQSPTFNKNGSVFISGLSSGNDGKRNYISVKDENKAICVSIEDDAQPFFVMPLGEETSTKIMICKLQPESSVDHFLGNNLKFTQKKENIEFTMTKPEDIPNTEHKWDIFFHFKKWFHDNYRKFTN